MACECKHCKECQGIPISSVCVEIENGDNLSCFVKETNDTLKILTKPHVIDIKTLSDKVNLTRDEITQILIDEIIKLKLANIALTNSINLCLSTDYTPVENCTDCN